MPVSDEKSTRERRLAAALRANLQRRKQEARQRAGEEGDRSGERERTDRAGAARPPRKP
jgi:hypothetical protein